MKRILGLDLGTNSIGWAIINKSLDKEGNESLCGIESAGSRIIPMDATILGDFAKGNKVSQTQNRTKARSTRRMYERGHLRRERLHRVLAIMGYLPIGYLSQLDRYGKFLPNREPKLAWYMDEANIPHFLFQDSFQEMLDTFKKYNPSVIAGSNKIPYDWTIYYLRKKALYQKIQKEELAWILLNFNQKRGYFQLRDEVTEQVSTKTRQYFDRQQVVDIIDTQEIYKGMKVLRVVLSDGTQGKIFKKEIPDWIGQVKDIIVTVDIDKEGKDKYDEDGSLSCRFKVPSETEWETEWILVKEKTQHDLEASGKSVGEYIFDTLLHNPMQKIRGKLVRTIERKYYKEELYRILSKQKEFHAELNDRKLYERCLEELYPNNPSHRNLMATHDLSYFLMNDILFYQRPLKSKKSLIDNCPFERHEYIDKVTNERKFAPVKCIAKSHPLFQEFRLWQFVSNLRIYQKEKEINGRLMTDVDVTQEFLRNEEDYVALFDWLNERKEIKQEQFFKYPVFGLKKDADQYRWNYVEDKSYCCNETRALMLVRLEKAGISRDFLTPEREEALWHILYSVSSKQELKLALSSFAGKNDLDIKFVDAFVNTPPFEKSYGAYSAKAIKKLLPLMRMGHYWKADDIDDHTRERIDKILTGECDEGIRNRVREKTLHLVDLPSFKGLPLWLASYIVYDRHSEAEEFCRWKSSQDIDEYLKTFKQYSLRNPIVEQVVLETLRTVRDIWKQVGRIDEIHVELGREMKNPSEKRKRMAQKMLENENTNLRIKALLVEFMNPELGIENVRPYSPAQQDLLRIYEEGAWNASNADDGLRDEMLGILKKFNESDAKKRPTSSDIKRYRLWLEQKYRSPYTGAVIPLSKLFTPAYEIEHVIPKALYFDDSFSNKVICESEVNKLKDKQLGYEFIKKHHGEKVQLSLGGVVEILSVDAYEQFVKENYSQNRTKMKKLLMDEIPEQFTERQMNDSRYISKLVVSLLSNIVRDEEEQEVQSRHVVVCTGGVTDRLKKDWGVNDVWNKIVLPRFERMNQQTGTSDFTSVNTSGRMIPAMPLHLQKGFSKKRIDHRHHAMDAIVIACASRNIVNYLNNQSAGENGKASRYDLQHMLCTKTQDGDGYQWVVNKPWETFTEDVYETLKDVIVSFKQNLRVINKTSNYYQRKENGKTILSKQDKGDNWAIRKSLHKETVYGEVNLRKISNATLKAVLSNPKVIVNKDLKRKLIEFISQGYSEKQIKNYFEEHKDSWREVNLKKIPVYYFTKDTKERFFASRKPLDESFNKDTIGSITDTGIQAILLRHLEEEGDDPKIAFSPEGIERMNKNMVRLNDGHPHQPIYKVRKYEKGDKFAVGTRGNRSSKFVEAAKGTNLFFAVYEQEQFDPNNGEIVKKRTFATIPLNVVISRQKRGECSAPADGNGNLPLFVLSPNDLVYVPAWEEVKSGQLPANPHPDRIYKMVSSSGNQCFFIQYGVSGMLWDKNEFSALNKMERSITGEMIKEICIPLKVDRLGHVAYKL